MITVYLEILAEIGVCKCAYAKAIYNFLKAHKDKLLTIMKY
jgi:hypothetical protein